MVAWIRANIKGLVVFFLFLGISYISFFEFSDTKVILSIIAAEIFLTFMAGALRFRLDKKFLVLLLLIILINVVVGYNKLYFSNLFLLSYCMWYFITKVTNKSRELFLIAFSISIVTIYLASLMYIKIPLFTIIFYPVYLLGYISQSGFSGKSILQDILITLCIPFDVFLLNCIFRIKGSYSVIRNMATFTIYNDDIKTLILTLFIWLIYSSLCVSASYLVYRIFTGIQKRKLFFADSSKEHKKSLILSINLKLIFTAFIVYFSDCILAKQIITDFNVFLNMHELINFMILLMVYIVIISLSGENLGRIMFYLSISIVFIANIVKLSFFDEPFYPWEVYLIKDAFMIGTRYINYQIVITITLISILLIMAVIKFRRHILHGLRPKLRVNMLILSLAILAMNVYILSNSKYLYQLDIDKSRCIGKVGAARNGLFLENFLIIKDYDEYIADKPEGYSKDSIVGVLDKLSRYNDVKVSSQINIKPNVIVIMSESFWDATQLKGVTFDKDIVENVRNNIKGYMVSPVFGGGTANVEFEVLTGLSNYFNNPGIIPYNVYLRRPTPSLANVFNKNDYDTIAIHPNDKNFYNRDSVYKYMGFKKFISIDSFDKQKDSKGTNVADEKLMDMIINQLSSGDNAKFIFAITMQNHDPYYNEYSKLEVNTSSKSLNEAEMSVLSNYASGIYDADRSFGKLISSLKNFDKPTVVYYFGDHLPRLGKPLGVYDVYNSLNYFNNKEKIDSDINSYITQLAIWSNYKDIPQLSSKISPAQLSLHILKESGVSYPIYFNILEQLNKEHPYLQNHLNGKEIQNEELVKDYKLIQYDLLFGNQYINEN
ncbi:sulfatase-like hydrolase/transferase [Clostridium sp. YIM B02505]|uniref:Sulfatase-like hydrolase/transferase n=1 Tax=Clostridium yunnanense TaxID=2800325 RepID=A0ABS1ETL1_9CLOT|nr:alkaline phosphatase family protein [Clostridium yunnanense]MBK1812638.1 sulfatase-like hydrolase/transferase [Clostridium yunnanense]